MAVFVADEQGDHPIDTDRIGRLADFVLTDQRVPAAMEVAILCVDVQAMAALNELHMDGEGPTDVLAFPIDLPGEPTAGEPAILGDVVVCPAVAAAQAASRAADLREELDLLVVHGLLHLLGHDHAAPEERSVMVGHTDRLLRAFRDSHEVGA